MSTCLLQSISPQNGPSKVNCTWTGGIPNSTPANVNVQQLHAVASRPEVRSTSSELVIFAANSAAREAPRAAEDNSPVYIRPWFYPSKTLIQF